MYIVSSAIFLYNSYTCSVICMKDVYMLMIIYFTQAEDPAIKVSHNKIQTPYAMQNTRIFVQKTQVYKKRLALS